MLKVIKNIFRKRLSDKELDKLIDIIRGTEESIKDKHKQEYPTCYPVINIETWNRKIVILGLYRGCGDNCKCKGCDEPLFHVKRKDLK